MIESQFVLRKLKRTGAFGRWPGYEVAHDRYGAWLFSPAGTVYWGHSSSESVIEWEVGRPPQAPEGAAELWLIPPNTWWVAKWDQVGAMRGIHVDIATPAELAGNEWSFTDLELDPYWHSDGEVGISDEDEFAAAIRDGMIRADEAASARRTADEVVGLLRDGVEPFGEIGWARFDESIGASRRPLWIEPLRSDAHGHVTA